MKSAVIISGQPRNVMENFKNIDQFILKPNNNPDVFIHSWINDEIFGTQEFSPWIEYKNLSSLHKKQFEKYKDYKYIPVCEKIPIDIGNKILDLYKPVGFRFEAPKEFSFDPIFYDIIPICKEEVDKRLPDTLSMYYSTFVSNQLKKTHEDKLQFKYDYVMKIRFDLAFSKAFIFSNYPKNKLTFSDHHWKHPICFTNMWALGSSKIMDCYAETYSSVESNIKQQKMAFTDECILGQQIFDCNIEKNPINFLTRIMRLKDVYI